MPTKKTVRLESAAHDLDWDGDNRGFVCAWVVPNLKLSPADRQVLCWAYGCDGGKSWEAESDGETVVSDMFLGGKIKSPAGVAHDYINRVPGHKTPDGHVWTAWESNALYRRVQAALGLTFRARWRRWLGLTIFSLWWWR